MQPGLQIGNWTLGQKLGEGGMGEVWRAHRTDQPRVVSALKKITGEVDANRAQRFVREAAILADLDHPGVPHLLDYSGQPMFLAMEFIEGTPLDEVLKKHGPLSVPDALEVARQLVDALAYIHARNVWHRDIKPANLVLQGDGWVKLVDFGVARGEGYADLTAAGMVVGTLSYMPPEAFRGQEGEPLAWDLYGAGVVLAKCLTGRSGFEVTSTGIQRQVDQAQRKLERPWVDVGGSVPEDVRDLVRKMTMQDPRQRITSPGDLGRRLQVLLRKYPGANLARVAGGPVQKVRKGPGILPWIVGAGLGLVVVAALALILAAVVGVGLWLSLG